MQVQQTEAEPLNYKLSSVLTIDSVENLAHALKKHLAENRESPNISLDASAKMLASSLEVIRVMGKVDAARISVANGDLNELINDLSIFQTSIAASLGKIAQLNHGMKHETLSAVSTLSAAS